MRTALDQFHEVSLVSLTEDDDGLRCIVSPMRVGSGFRVDEDLSQKRVVVNFGMVSGYLVVPEIVQAGLNLECSDEFVVSEVLNSRILAELGFQVFGKADRHFVLRTSHQYVNVFIEGGGDGTGGVVLTAC